ncbi:hypothetical protein C8F04DRAFT_1339278 [Mycena alexandri]|uniref:Uncharacterized protein n=1 Tax=Mycena alexandri TaxID=1745969 RepID=A0AAD6RX77_9AGAR|nr:hypothetical protein C8F04DRAFT_1339278 [Mycena alexandri]
MFVPDLLHEIELGVVKSLFIHILRILYDIGGDSVAELDKRFRQIPTFGRSTIQRFDTNVSEIKKLAARNSEDILQCLIPVLEGLLPEPHNGILLSLIFTLATWHAYGKLRMHSSSSIGAFRNVTAEFSASARHFKRTTCKAYTTYELPKEQERRGRRDAAKDPNRVTASSAKVKNSECKHREVKGSCARTNRRNHSRQIANHERRQRLLRAINRHMATAAASEAANAAAAAGESTQPPTPATPSPAAQRTAVTDLLQPQEDPLPRTPPRLHHHISESKRSWLDIYEFPALLILQNDPAVPEFLPKLKAHLLSRLLGLPYDGDETEFSPQDLLNITIMRDRIYSHKVMRVNYTTYDVQGDQDSINPHTHSDIMLLSHEDKDDNPHPYWYARILGIFHTEVCHIGEQSKSARPIRMEFLWLRWFGHDIHHKAGWATRRLHRVGFVDFASGGAFGFIDPSELIRGAHLIPAFHYGLTSDLLPKSIARRPEQNDEDFNYYYVNQFVDRDMFMRYSDNAVGHRTSVPSGSAPPMEPIVSNTVLDNDDMDVNPEPDEEPEVEENLVDGPDGDKEGSDSDFDWSEPEDEPDANEENEEEEGAGELDADGPGGDPDEEDIIDSFGYDSL